LDLQEDTSLSQSWEIATIYGSLPPAIVAIILICMNAYHCQKIYLVLGAVLLAISVTEAASAPANETKKIETLIKQVNELKDAKFVRNGSTYTSRHAATFLRRKWQANDAGVKTARDFIDKVASVSGTSGKPYLIRFDDGKEIPSRDFLLAQLQRLESPL
jgi:hypothetical protein